MTPLMIAAQRGDVHTCRMLEREEASLNMKAGSTLKSQTALHFAADAMDEYDKVVDVLIKAKADVNIPDDDGNTPLHLAVIHNHVKVVSYLIQYNANVAYQNRDGTTSLHLACLHGSISIVNILIENGGDVLEEDELGRSSLHYAYLRYEMIMYCDTWDVGESYNSTRGFDPSIAK